jgi:hypothetical protein
MAKTKSNPGHRQKVDIYFVLYLIALVLLIPVGTVSILDSDNGNETSDIDTNLYAEYLSEIYLEKSKLLLSLSSNDSTVSINYADTINSIIIDRVNGNQQPEVNITNLNFNSSYTFQGSFDTEKFKLEKIDDVSYRFVWMPMGNMDGLYKGKIDADEYVVAISIGESTREFTVSTFLDQSSQIDISQADSLTIAELSQPQNTAISVFNNSFELQPSKTVVQSISREPWQNRINIFGATADDLKGGINIKSDDSSVNPSIIDISPKYITIRGLAPLYNKADITLSAQHRISGTSTSVTFSVEPIALTEPELPDQMFPNVSYRIKPNYPPVAEFEYRSVLLLGSDTVNSIRGASSIEYTPELSDISKRARLIRFINGRLVSTSKAIDIVKPPEPIIVDVNPTGDNTYIVRTRAYGGTKDKPQLVKELIISPGPESVSELFGEARQCGDGCYEQKFRVNMASPIDKITVQAIDGMNLKSQIWKN